MSPNETGIKSPAGRQSSPAILLRIDHFCFIAERRPATIATGAAGRDG